MKGKYLFGFFAIIIVAQFGVRSLLSSSEKIATHTYTVNDCSIVEKTCTVILGPEQSLVIDVLPRGMPQTKPATVDIILKGIHADKVLIKFTSPAISYAPPAFTLNKINRTHFNGEAFLSLCTLEEISWEALVTVHDGKESWQIIFPFVHSDTTKAPYS